MFSHRKKTPVIRFSKEQKKQIIYIFSRWKNKYKLIEDYVLHDGNRHPFALICPGGSYSSVCNFTEGVPYARKLNQNGISAFILYYHVKKKGRYPAPQQDVARALKYIFSKAKEWNLETVSYSIWGSSAGGHLAASFCAEKTGYPLYNLPRPAALILCYPVITMGKLAHKESKKNLLGKIPNDQLIKLLSVEEQVTGSFPPTFLWCGDNDYIVSPENSKSMAIALKKTGVPYEFHIYPGINHGASLALRTSAEKWFDQAVAFWQKYMLS